MTLVPVHDAVSRILKSARAKGSETVKLADALGRICAADIRARCSQPPFNASAMDGYALRHADLATIPATLKLIGTSAAGHSFKGQVNAGQTARIFTGAAVPRGADTVVIQENVQASGQNITVLEPITKGRNIRLRGLDFAKADVLVPTGTKLGSRDIGLAAAGNNQLIRVRMKPRIALLSTGDELAVPGAKLLSDQIAASNAPALAALVMSCGGQVFDLGLIKDDVRAITSAIRKGAACDILVITGGASVGDHDVVQEALIRAGVKLNFWKIAMRPGKPMMFGTRARLCVLGLPGNPVAALVCAQVFLRPLIAAMLGTTPSPAPVMARLAIDLAGNDQRQDYLRASLKIAADGAREVSVLPKQDSSMQKLLREATCLIIRKPHAQPAKIGDMVEILLFSDGA